MLRLGKGTTQQPRYSYRATGRRGGPRGEEGTAPMRRRGVGRNDKGGASATKTPWSWYLHSVGQVASPVNPVRSGANTRRPVRRVRCAGWGRRLEADTRRTGAADIRVPICVAITVAARQSETEAADDGGALATIVQHSNRSTRQRVVMSLPVYPQGGLTELGGREVAGGARRG